MKYGLHWIGLLAAIGLAGCAVKDADAVALPAQGAAGKTAAAPASRPDPDAGAGEPDPAARAEGVPYTGTVEAHRRSNLSPKISGSIARVHVREGDRVTAGDPLVTFDMKDVTLRLRQARAALEGAKIQRDAAEDEARRVRTLAESSAASQAQVDGVEFKRRGAEVGVASAQVAVEMGEKAVGDSIVRAPYDGVIVRRFVNEGDYATLMPPTMLIAIEETAVLDLRIQVPSSEMGRIREGDPVTIGFPGLRRTIRADVTRIVGSIDARTRNFSVIVEIPNADGALLPGLFAEARFGAGPAAGDVP